MKSNLAGLSLVVTMLGHGTAGWAQSSAATPAATPIQATPTQASTQSAASVSAKAPLVEEPIVTERPEPAVQHAVIEDQGSKIDELRVRGQMRYIVVTPKVGTSKSYQIVVNNDGRAPFEGTGGVAGAIGKRVWNVFDF